MFGNITLREMLEPDWESVAEIYKQGLETGNSTFQQEVPSWEDWNAGHLKNCRIVAEIDNHIVGWGALSPVSSRCVYAGVAEVSVYISNIHRGKKIGRQLLNQLIIESEGHGYWTLQAGIFPENKPSLKIHRDLGFRDIGYREKIGKMNGIWRDTLLLERRSKTIGIE